MQVLSELLGEINVITPKNEANIQTTKLFFTSQVRF